jgi:hypothetical protein
MERVEADGADAGATEGRDGDSIEALRRELAESERERRELALEIRVRTAESESLRKAVAEQRGEVERQAELLERLRTAAARREARSGRVVEGERQDKKLRDRLQATTAKLKQAERERDQLRAQLRQGKRQLRDGEQHVAAVREETAALYIEALPRRRLHTAGRVAGWLLRFRLRDVRAYSAIRRSGRFDVRRYLTEYPEVAVAGENPIIDYVEKGVAEGRDPRADFDSRRYLTRHPELADSGLNPFVHYLRSEPEPAGRSDSAGR